MLLAQAQANGVDLLVDTNTLENEFLLKQIAVSEQTALSRPASDFIRRNNTLGRIGGVTTVTVSDPKASKVRGKGGRSSSCQLQTMPWGGSEA